MKYRLNVVDGVVRSKESISHIKDYQLGKGEIISDTDLPVPCKLIFDDGGKVTGFEALPIELTEREPTMQEAVAEIQAFLAEKHGFKPTKTPK